MGRLHRRGGLFVVVAITVIATSVAPRARPSAAAAMQSSGAVVEQVLGRWAAAKGIQPGDIITTWRRDASPSMPGASGQITSSLELRDVELEQAPRGLIVLAGRRGDSSFEWTVIPGPWTLVSRPVLPDAILTLHNEAIAHRQGGRPIDAAAAWRKAAAEAGRLSEPALATWILGRAAVEMANVAVWAEADPLFDATVQSVPEKDALRRGRMLTTWGRTFEGRSNWEQALQRYTQALALRRAHSAESLEAASILALMGGVHSTRGTLETAEPLLEESRAIREKLAPGSLELADSLVALATLASRRRDLDRAIRFADAALEIQRRLVPDSLTVAFTINTLGVYAAWKGDLATAARHFENALVIRQKLAPGSRDVAMSLMNLGGIARDRADIPAAADYFERALATAEKAAGMAPLDLAPILQNIGNVAADRGDFAKADEYTRRALDIRLKLAPETLDTALSLGSLGVIAWSRGDAAASADYHRRALAIQQKLVPKGADTARTLSNLGLVAWKSGDLASARRSFDGALELLQSDKTFAMQYGTTLMNRGLLPLAAGDLAAAEADFTRALEIFQAAASSTLEASMALNNLGDIATRRGTLDKAIAYHKEALEIRTAIAPLTSSEAESYHALGSLERRRNALPAAAEYFAKAVHALEAQAGRLGGSQDVQSGFSGGFTEYYEDWAAALVDLGRPAEAFAAIERSRARTLVAMMAERDVQFAGAAGELAKAYDRNRRDTDRVYARLASLSPRKDNAEAQTLLGQLRTLRDDRESLAARARTEHARFADLQFPRPLDLAGATAALDPGMVALSYSIGKTRSFVFVLHPPTATAPSGLTVLPISVTDDGLRTRVEAFRKAIGPAADGSVRAVGSLAPRRPGALPPGALTKQATELYDLLIRPAETIVARSQRVMIVPDGALHALPFGALMPSGKVSGGARYLIEWKPFHLAASTTIYESLRQSRPSSTASAGTLVAFGDPAYATTLARLPSTRAEVQRIAGRFPSRATVYVGATATEEQAKRVPPDARYVHFAVHGFVDNRFPLNSALVLTQPATASGERDNGLLQVWEIFEQLRLGADLVTLSACETALGQELGGEGILGLTRAFHYAGARSVVASLWSVADDSTADLMARFYGHLASGKSKDEALRAAQLDLIRGTGQTKDAARLSHPFHWASFQVFGDWR